METNYNTELFSPLIPPKCLVWSCGLSARTLDWACVKFVFSQTYLIGYVNFLCLVVNGFHSCSKAAFSYRNPKSDLVQEVMKHMDSYISVQLPHCGPHNEAQRTLASLA